MQGMADSRLLGEILGFIITDGGELIYAGGKARRPATVDELTMWRLLVTPQSAWFD